MALITTPGAANADSYASATEADAYFSARGVTTWTGSTEAKEAALRRATTYLDNQYRDRWKGVRYAQEQALAWPRAEGYRGYAGGLIEPMLDADGFEISYETIPLQVRNATIEAALLTLGGTALEPNLERGGAIKSIGKSVGPLRKDITYMDGAPAETRYTAIEGLLRGLVKSTPGSTVSNVTLVRA